MKKGTQERYSVGE